MNEDTLEVINESKVKTTLQSPLHNEKSSSTLAPNEPVGLAPNPESAKLKDSKADTLGHFNDAPQTSVLSSQNLKESTIFLRAMEPSKWEGSPPATKENSNTDLKKLFPPVIQSFPKSKSPDRADPTMPAGPLSQVLLQRNDT